MQMILFGGNRGLGKVIRDAFPDAKSIVRGVCDLQSEDQIRDVFDSLSINGPINIVNATGLCINARVKNVEWSDLESMFRVNVFPNFYILKHAYELAKRGGSFTILSSVLASKGVPGAAMYSSCKAAIAGFVRSAAVEMAPHGFRVNAIELGYFDKGMISQVPPKYVEALKDYLIPLKRLGMDGELVSAVKFALGCSYLTGQVLPVNGGLI